MEEASEESSHSARANGMNEYLMCHNGTPPRGTVLRDGLTQNNGKSWRFLLVTQSPTMSMKTEKLRLPPAKKKLAIKITRWCPL